MNSLNPKPRPCKARAGSTITTRSAAVKFKPTPPTAVVRSMHLVGKGFDVRVRRAGLEFRVIGDLRLRVTKDGSGVRMVRVKV